MNSGNTNRHARPTLATLDAMDRRTRVVAVDIDDGPELSVADDPDLGADPYNSTGRHVIIKSRLQLED